MDPTTTEGKVPGLSTRLVVQRTGIRFRHLGADTLQVEVEVENHGALPSAPARLEVRAAAFGAFLAWRPLTRLRVPTIAPNGRTVVSAQTWLPRLERFLRSAIPAATTTDVDPVVHRSRGEGELPADWRYLYDMQPYCAGNLDVCVGDRGVERHMATGLRLQPGRVNMFGFEVGKGADAYAFRIQRPDPGWDCALYSSDGGVIARGSETSEQPQWHSFERQADLVLGIRVPEECGACEQARAVVHVTQRSSGRTVPVEFELDPSPEESERPTP